MLCDFKLNYKVTNKRLNSKIYKQYIQLSIKKIQQKKWAEDLNRFF